MFEQEALFDIPAQEKPTKSNDNPCLTLYGNGPEGAICRDCIHFVGIAKAKTYYKCKLRKNTHGTATDHKSKWLACGKFEWREGDIPLYDGRG